MATQTKPRIELRLHPAQRTVHDSRARFKVVACGRRFGKTTLAVGESLSFAGSRPNSLIWWVAPNYDLTKEGMRMALEAVPVSLREIRRSDRELVLWNGSRFRFRTADNPDTLRAEGVDFLVVDEAAFVKEEAWYSALRPTLADSRGRALLIGTFQGENWFYDLYERGQDESFPEWVSFRFKTSANPFIDPEEIEEARRTTPRAEFEQEWEANPLIYVGAVFPGEKVQEATERAAEIRDDLPKYAGLDWGYTNATAFEVCQEDAEGRISWFDERSWVATQLGPGEGTRITEIVDLCARYKIEAIYADGAGATENAALADALDRSGARAELVGVHFGKRLKGIGETNKEGGIKARRWFLENDLESMDPKGVPELIRTTKRYRYKENSEDVEKEDDHQVDAATAFYASRRHQIVEDR